jgi:hypothetical protein
LNISHRILENMDGNTFRSSIKRATKRFTWQF